MNQKNILFECQLDNRKILKHVKIDCKFPCRSKTHTKHKIHNKFMLMLSTSFLLFWGEKNVFNIQLILFLNLRMRPKTFCMFWTYCQWQWPTTSNYHSSLVSPPFGIKHVKKYTFRYSDFISHAAKYNE